MKNNSVFYRPNTIYILKFFAILSVVCAHGTGVPSHFSKASQYVSSVVGEFGAVGVGVFFTLSGYLLATGSSKNLPFSNFLKKKFITIGIPWLLSSSLVFLYQTIRKGGTLAKYFMDLVGYGTSYWYLSVLFILYIIYYYVLKKHSLFLVYLLGFASFVSITMRFLGIIKQDAVGIYLNIFNWSIFFSYGILISRNSLIFERIAQKFDLFLLVGEIVVIFVFPFLGFNFSYFNYAYIIIEIPFIAGLWGVSSRISNKPNIGLVHIGKISFPIYLYGELPWAGLFAYVGNKVDCWLLIPLRPLLVLFFTAFTLFVGNKIATKVGLGKVYSILFAYKEKQLL